MEEELIKVRGEIRAKKTDREKALEEELSSACKSRENALEQYRAIQSLVMVMKFQIGRVNEMLEE